MAHIVKAACILAMSAAIAAPAVARPAPNDGQSVGWQRVDAGYRSMPDEPRLRDKAYVKGLKHMSLGLEARDAGDKEQACKHFRSAEKSFRRAGDAWSKAWSVERLEETCPTA